MPEPEISVVICTRNRGASIVHTLESVLANQHPSFEVIVVDQSTNDETMEAITPYASDPRFRYIRSDTVGTGRSRNIGLRAAKAEIVAYTDDDCIVPTDWLEKIIDFFTNSPSVAVGFCSVAPGAHDPETGAVPSHRYKTNQIYCSLREYYAGIGMGAGMIVRRQEALALKGFDNQLGPGSKFFSAEDHDFALRVLINHYCVGEIANTEVVHNGFRTYSEFRELTRRDWIAIGAVYGKFLRCFQYEILFLITYNSLIRGIIEPFGRFAHFQKPQGFKRLFYLWNGIFLGISSPVNSLSYQFAESQ